VVPVVTAASIESYRTDLIRVKMPSLNPSLTKSILNGKNGPLGTIDHKIDMAEALEVVCNKLAHDARHIARNSKPLAHELSVDSFDHVRVRDIVEQLKGGQPSVMGVRRWN
jgi:hypothetical protein